MLRLGSGQVRDGDKYGGRGKCPTCDSGDQVGIA